MLNTKRIYDFLWFSELTVISFLSDIGPPTFVCVCYEDGDWIAACIVDALHASRGDSNLGTTGASEAESKTILWYYRYS
jgi:hypothetical protein